jgi:HD-GYP domain-containing protein (c-di-GMP phosphodiesterase class II)
LWLDGTIRAQPLRHHDRGRDPQDPDRRHRRPAARHRQGPGAGRHLNKPGRLTDEEFEIVRRHPRDGYDILRRSPDIGAIPLDITLHHHERRDGTGYPDRQGEQDISELAQMAAIVDVYDAITADRCYHKGMPAAEALCKMYEWSNSISIRR